MKGSTVIDVSPIVSMLFHLFISLNMSFSHYHQSQCVAPGQGTEFNWFGAVALKQLMWPSKMLRKESPSVAVQQSHDWTLIFFFWHKNAFPEMFSTFMNLLDIGILHFPAAQQQSVLKIHFISQKKFFSLNWTIVSKALHL